MSDNPPLVIANLKANKTWDEMITWLDHVGPKAEKSKGTVIVCPTSPFLESTAQKIKDSDYHLKLGAQDVSQFEQGSYTGEFAASQIATLCQYVIIGHSERRQNFDEDDDVLGKKVKNTLAASLAPIFCIQDENTHIPEGVKIVAYEPIFAIGTGNPDTPQNAQEIAQKLKARGNYTVIYGGSVTDENVAGFLKEDLIEGVLVGNASLDPQEFTTIIDSASF